MRRLNQRYDPVGPLSSKLILQRLMSTKSVPSTELRTALEYVEKSFLEYEQRSGHALPDDMQLVVVEQLLSEPIKTHVALNGERLSTLPILRAEILKYADRISLERTMSGGASPMEVDALTWPKGKGKWPKGKGKGKSDYAQPKGKGKRVTKVKASHKSDSKELVLIVVNKDIAHPNVVPPRPLRYLKARAKAKEKEKGKAKREPRILLRRKTIRAIRTPNPSPLASCVC